MGAQILDKTSQNSLDVEEFLAGLRFEQRGEIRGAANQIMIITEEIQLYESWHT